MLSSTAESSLDPILNLPSSPRWTLTITVLAGEILDPPEAHVLDEEGPLVVGRDPSAQLVLRDKEVSRAHAVMRFIGGNWHVADQDSSNGVFINGRRATRGILSPDDVVAFGPRSFGVLSHFVKVDGPEELHGLFSASNATRLLLRQLEQLAPGGATILFLGETGVGKSSCASVVHKLSALQGRFEEVNCASLSPALAESTLFGHERGAFTGAVARHPGLVEMADGGTLFLDEFGELPLETQAKLLTFIERRQFRRVGGSDVRKANVRILAATNRDPADAIRAGLIREDLFARIATPAIEVPALSARREEIPLLVSRGFGVDSHQRRWLTPAVLHALSVRKWSRNLRELFELVAALKRAPQKAEYVDVGFLQELVRAAIDVDAGLAAPQSVPDDIRGAILVARALLTEQDEFSEVDFRERMCIPKRTSQRLLSELVERGFLGNRGQGKATKFVDPLKPIADSLNERKQGK